MELFRVLKAYSIYDSELGYCQGTNFIVATLLVQMPEERKVMRSFMKIFERQRFKILIMVIINIRAFATFCCFMFRYGLREIYINNFEGLTRILFFIDELLKDNSHKLRKHLGKAKKNNHFLFKIYLSI